MPRNPRVALCFFGKHGDDAGPSRAMLPNATASTPILRASFASWRDRVVLANPQLHFDVFAHSWSPEVASLFETLWTLRPSGAGGNRARPLLARHAHEPTMYKREGQNGLAFRCEVSHGNCERSASALLSLSRVLRLKQDYELLEGKRYAAAIVARHDLLFARDFRLPPQMLGPGSRTLGLPSECFGKCGVLWPKSLRTGADPRFAPPPPHCALRGRACPVPYITGRKRAWRVIDWLFWASNDAADTMGDVMRHLGPYTSDLRGMGVLFSATHYLWSYHAHRSGLTMEFGPLLVERDVALARTVPPAHRERPADALYCFNDAGGRVGRGLDNLTALPHPEALNRQCPWEFTLACHADTNCAGRAAPSPPS